MSKYKVYISSTFLDMAPLRKQILDCIHFRLHEWFEFTEVMEKMRGDAANRSDIDICLANVREADVYILLMGKRYGLAPDRYTDSTRTVVPNTERSYTWLEYEAACEKIKRNHIYKLELTDAFFKKEQLDAHSDLNDKVKEEHYKHFNLKVGQTVNAISINSFSELGDEINLLLTKSYFQFNTVVQLNLDEHKGAIDRQPQVDCLRDRSLDPQSSVASLIINSKDHEEDEVVVFSRRLKEIFRPNEITEIQRNLEFVNLNIFSNLARGDLPQNATSDEKDLDKIRNAILIESSANILGARAGRVNFDSLYKEIERKNIQNRFLGYTIDLRLESELVFKLIRYLQYFIHYLNKFLDDNGFVYNFFIVLSVVSKNDLEGQFVSKYMPGLDTELYNFERLSNIEVSHIESWIDTIIKNKGDNFITNFNSIRSDIINQIFIDTRSFPKTYKECLKDIKLRAK